MTIDVCQIPHKPFGLLSEAEQRALIKHGRQGGQLQRFTGHRTWESVPRSNITIRNQFTYRAAPEPLRDISCTLPGVSIWDLFDEGVVAFARDKGGVITAYLSVPHLGKIAWVGHVAVSFPKSFTAIDPGNMPWDESLIVRPSWEGE